MIKLYVCKFHVVKKWNIFLKNLIKILNLNFKLNNLYFLKLTLKWKIQANILCFIVPCMSVFITTNKNLKKNILLTLNFNYFSHKFLLKFNFLVQ